MYFLQKGICSSYSQDLRFVGSFSNMELMQSTQSCVYPYSLEIKGASPYVMAYIA